MGCGEGIVNDYSGGGEIGRQFDTIGIVEEEVLELSSFLGGRLYRRLNW